MGYDQRTSRSYLGGKFYSPGGSAILGLDISVLMNQTQNSRGEHVTVFVCYLHKICIISTAVPRGSCRSFIVKFPDLSSHRMTISLTYRNNNPIAKMSEMVHYILRFVITMKHFIYGAILSAVSESGAVLYAPPAEIILMHFSLKI